MEKKKGTIKGDKGITLIALVVTIIVLLILAGITVSLIMNDGIIFKANETSIKSKVAEIEEAVKLTIAEEKIVVNTEEPIIDEWGNNNGWENAPHLEFFEFYKTPEADMYYGIGNVYDKATGEMIKEKLMIFFSDVIQDNKNAGLGFSDLGIDIDIGENGYMEKAMESFMQGARMPSTDVFAIDQNYNIYYLDKAGNIYTSSTKYEASDIILGKTYFNPDLLTPEEKKVYDGIYEGALAYTENEGYAKYLATNDFDVLTNNDTFLFNGYVTFTLNNDDGTIATLNNKNLEGLAKLMTRPDWTVVKIVGEDPIRVDYYMDKEYNIYEIDSTNPDINVVKDKEGNTIQVKKTNIIPKLATDYNEYKIMERFDKKDVVVYEVPDRENLDMKADLAGLNVYSTLTSIFSGKSVKTVILPDTIKTVAYTALWRTMNTGAFADGMFEDSMNLEEITLPNNIQKIYAETFRNCPNLKTVIMPDNVDEIGQDAFKECKGVTVKFKDGKAPEGAPWGGTEINITSK